MKEKRYNAYKKMRKTLLAGASSGIVAGMILMGSANTALADTSDLAVPAYIQNTSATGMHVMHRWNSSGRVSSLANQLGIPVDEVKAELKSGKNIKQILQDHGIVIEQIDKAYVNKNNKKRNPNY